jgi:hypothetical protein
MRNFHGSTPGPKASTPRRVLAACAIIAAGAASFALGAGAGARGQGTRPQGAAPASATDRPPNAIRRRVPKLVALDVVVDTEQLRTFDAAAVASLSAKKWTEMAGERARAPFGAEANRQALQSYLEGWLAVVKVSAPYSASQFAEGLREELCGKRPDELRFLKEASSALSGLEIPACTE